MQAPAARSGGAAGVSHDSPRTPNVHISGPLHFKNTKIQREDTQRDTKRTNFAAGEGKKSEILGGPAKGGPGKGGPGKGGPGKGGPGKGGPGKGGPGGTKHDP